MSDDPHAPEPQPASDAPAAAPVQPDESIDEWLGPVNTQDWAGMGYEDPKVEMIDEQPINTLLFTTRQTIGITLALSDLEELHRMGPAADTANRALEAMRPFRVWNANNPGLQEAGPAKGIQFGALNAKRWPELVDALRAQSLAAVVLAHRYFGLPHDRVQSVDIHSRFVSPGLTFHLTDGSKIRYTTFKKDRLAGIADYLKQFLIQVK